jgi:hypothetical protein
MAVAPKRMSAPRWCLDGFSKTHHTKYARKIRGHVLYIKLGRHVFKEEAAEDGSSKAHDMHGY